MWRLIRSFVDKNTWVLSGIRSLTANPSSGLWDNSFGILSPSPNVNCLCLGNCFRFTCAGCEKLARHRHLRRLNEIATLLKQNYRAITKCMSLAYKHDAVPHMVDVKFGLTKICCNLTAYTTPLRQNFPSPSRYLTSFYYAGNISLHHGLWAN